MVLGVALLLSTVPDGRVFGLDRQTVVGVGIQLLNACVLAVALSFILYGPLREFMRKRTSRIESQLNQVHDERAQAEELKTQYEEKLEAVDAECLEILESARLLAVEKSAETLDAVKKEAESMRRRAAEDILGEQTRFREIAMRQIIDISSLMAAKFVAHAIDRDTQDRLFAETIAELEDMVWPT